MYISQNRNNKGFTIVELLIVVVIIAIITALAIVTYGSMRNRAHASRAGSVASTYIKLLKMHKSDKGAYPVVAAPACLSSEGTMPAADGFAANECGLGWFAATINPSLNTALTNYSTSTINGLLPTVRLEGSSIRGILYESESDGSSATLTYTLPGDSPCPQGSTEIYGDGTTDCIIHLDNGNYDDSGGVAM